MSIYVIYFACYIQLWCIVLVQKVLLLSLLNPVVVMRQLAFNALVPYLYRMIYIVMCVIVLVYRANI